MVLYKVLWNSTSKVRSKILAIDEFLFYLFFLAGDCMLPYHIDASFLLLHSSFCLETSQRNDM